MSEHLREAAARRRRDAEDRAAKALQTMSRNGDVINFVAVARKAGVSTDFLYRHPSLRERVIALRMPQASPAAAVPTTAEVGAADASSAVRLLAAQLGQLRARHRDEVAHLQNALAAAHGENLRLRRRADMGEVLPEGVTGTPDGGDHDSLSTSSVTTLNASGAGQ